MIYINVKIVIAVNNYNIMNNLNNETVGDISNRTAIYKFLHLFYSELFNKNLSFKQKFMRISARTPLRDIICNIFCFFKKKNKKLLPINSDHFIGKIDSEKIFEDLKSKGQSTNLKLNKSVVSKILQRIENEKFYVNREAVKVLNINMDQAGDESGKIYLRQKTINDKIYIMRLLNPHKTIREVNEIAHNLDIINAVKKYLKMEPLISSTAIWCTFPHKDENNNLINGPGNEFGYHYDVDDLKYLKLFFYLNNVDENSGPHVYIENNRNKTFGEFLDRRISEATARKRYKNNIKVMLGSTGDGFIEDVSFYHKGTNPVKESGRKLLQIVYGIHHW